MLSEANAIIEAVRKITDIFGFDYVKEHKSSPVCKSVENNILSFSYLFEDKHQRPDLDADYKGWAVYVTVEVNMETKNTTVINYVLPDGTKMIS